MSDLSAAFGRAFVSLRAAALACVASLGVTLAAAESGAPRFVLGSPAHPYPLAEGAASTTLPADRLAEALPLAAEPELGGGRARLVLRLADGESLHGLGAWFLDWDLRGRVLETWLQDRIHGGRGSSYFASPFFLSSEGYGLFVNCTGRVRFDFGVTSPGELVIEAPEEGLDLHVFRGTPAEIVRAYTAVVGRPPEVPDWVLRLWISRNSYLSAAEIEEVLARCVAENIPVGCVVLEAWAETLQSFTFETDRYPQPGTWLTSLRSRGIAPVLWITPSTWTSSPIYPVARERGFLVGGSQGGELVLDWLEGARKINFALPDARAWWAGLPRDLVAMGVEGFKTDGGERNPDPFFHNLQPFHYQESTLAAFTGSGRAGITFARSASAVSTRTGTFWAGDQDAKWASLAEAIRAGLGAGLSGFAYYGHDIGGYIGDPSPELYIRWFQLGAFSPIMQWHGIPAREPWEFGSAAVAQASYYARLRERLVPYLRSAARSAVEQGTPLWRPLAWAHPKDPAAWRVEDQFYLGDELLVAPVLQPGGRRSIYLPEGNWRDLFTEAAHTGPVRIDYTAPLERIPVFVRAERAAEWFELRGEQPRSEATGLVVEQIAPRMPDAARTRSFELRPDGRAVVGWDLVNTTDRALDVSVRGSAPKGLLIAAGADATVRLEPGARRRLAASLELDDATPPGWALPATFTFEPATGAAARTESFHLARPLAWRVAGPFDGTVRAPHRGIDPAAPFSGSTTWSDCPPSAIDLDGQVSLARALGREPAGSFYAHATLVAPAAGRAVLRVGSGDAVSVWLNGSLVHERVLHGNHHLLSHAVNVTLRAGDNSLLVRVTRQIGPAAFSLRVEAPSADSPLPSP
jgi:alpha-D-xyloside xylohydrolase